MKKYVVTHASPDWDAITSVWLIKKYLPGWHEAEILFVPAGQRLAKAEQDGSKILEAVEMIGEDEYIHMDTGLGPLDHHQTSDDTVSAASRTWDYVQEENPDFAEHSSKRMHEKVEAITRIVTVVVALDHFKEVFWADTTADYHEFSLFGLLEGLKLAKPNEDAYYVTFGIDCLDALAHTFENRIWAEKEMKEKGIEFETKWGKGLGIETINDTFLKLAQKMGYPIVIRKDPRKGYVRIKARPTQAQNLEQKTKNEKNIDLTLVYEKLRKMDPEATWFLHVSKKMLLNGTPKNPKMKPTKLSLQEIISVLKTA